MEGKRHDGCCNSITIDSIAAARNERVQPAVAPATYGPARTRTYHDEAQLTHSLHLNIAEVSAHTETDARSANLSAPHRTAPHMLFGRTERSLNRLAHIRTHTRYQTLPIADDLRVRTNSISNNSVTNNQPTITRFDERTQKRFLPSLG